MVAKILRPNIMVIKKRETFPLRLRYIQYAEGRTTIVQAPKVIAIGHEKGRLRVEWYSAPSS